MKRVRPIDANTLDVEQINCFYGDQCRIDDVKEWLDDAPTLDCVPVVRCADCEHSRWIKMELFPDDRLRNYLNCDACGRIVDPLAYCSTGVRRTKEAGNNG